MDIRRLVVICDTVNSEAGLPALRPVTRAAAGLCRRLDHATAADLDFHERSAVEIREPELTTVDAGGWWRRLIDTIKLWFA